MDKYNIPDVKTYEYTKIIGIENIDFGKYIIIDDFVLIYAKEQINIGNYVHIASFTSIIGGGGFIMEDFSGLASGCRVITGSDDFKESGFGNPTINSKFRNLKTALVKISKFAIIGTNTVILPNVTIGEGATVGANSVITKNLEPWGIYVGNKRVGWRDKEAVLKNYELFLDTPENERVGNSFK
ncbi:MAG: acyltransferase [Sulfurospirillum sp.]|nr:acyltransferase [Sulfurospirillum sp.]MBL0702824.1 acyltransferase [Sulfurospirillum sp.]